MRVLLRVLCLLICLTTYAAKLSAGMVLTAGTGSFEIGSGVREVDVFVRSDNSDSTLFLTADFRLSGGKFPAKAGTFGEAGFVGFGNIAAGNASSFTSSGNNTSALSLDFVAPQLLPSSNTTVARMNIDITGLAIGNYQIEVTGVASGVASNRFNGSFEIRAVPEPAPFLSISICVAGLWIARRSRIWNWGWF